jgi:hypothetical protein
MLPAGTAHPLLPLRDLFTCGIVPLEEYQVNEISESYQPFASVQSVAGEVVMPDDYEYDVFLSYKRNQLTAPWIEGFKARLTYWLTQELGGREAKVFFDIESIEVGDPWPDKLREALKVSRCLVGMWSPDYFRSRWCVSEWRSFLEREKQAGVPGARLVAPIKCHDGEHFPSEAQNIQQFDPSQYWRTVPKNFWDTEPAMKAEDLVKQFAKRLAAIVQQAPLFNPAWGIVDADPAPLPTSVSLRRL